MEKQAVTGLAVGSGAERSEGQDPAGSGRPQDVKPGRSSRFPNGPATFPPSTTSSGCALTD